MDFWQTILISVLSGGTVAIINFFLVIKQKSREIERNQKIKAYSEFLDMARGFLNDPTLNFDESLNSQKNFIKKFYNEIWVSASSDVIKKINGFFETVSITHANENDQTKALNDLILAIRADLGLTTDNKLNGKYKIYTPNKEALNREKTE
jgi:hypothetical protein